MSTRIEGYNSFSNYDCLHFLLESTRKRTIQSIQLTFGSYLESDSETFMSDIKQHNYKLKQFFYNHHKDGYYKERFIYIDGMTQRLKERKKGLYFNQAFFYLEEEYEKSFVNEYFSTLFPTLNELHKKNSTIKFIKYTNNAKK